MNIFYSQLMVEKTYRPTVTQIQNIYISITVITYDAYATMYMTGLALC